MGIGITGILQNLSGSSDKDLYGAKPRNAPHIDYTSALQEAIGTNISLLPSLKELGLLSTDAFTAMLERALPGYTGLRDSTTGIIQDKLKGKIPRDVQANLDRNLQEKGIAMGTSGSDFNKYGGVYGDLLTSYAIQNQGLQQSSAWLAQNRGNAFDFTKMFLSKDDAMKRTEFNWSVDRMNELVRVAPDPQVRGAWDSEMGLIGQILSIYSGGAGYTQTYKPHPGGGGDEFSPSGNPWGTDYGHESYFGGTEGLPRGIRQGPNEGTGE